MTHAGSLAPSGDNLQPWSFAVDGRSLLIKHNPQRDLSLFNVKSLASYIALGAVIENVAIAASGDGYRAEVEYDSDDNEYPLVARITFQPAAEKDPLGSYLEERCTNRKPYADTALDPEILNRLIVAADLFPTIKLSWVQDKYRLRQLGQIIAQADRFIFENPRIHEHLFSTIRWNQLEVESTRDGLPINSLELGRTGSLAFRALKRWSVVNFLNRFGFSKSAAQRSVMLMRQCSASGLITAPDTSQLSFMLAGRAFQRVWLQAAKESLAFQPMTAIIFLQLRSQLSDYQGFTQQQASALDEIRQNLIEFFKLPEDQVPTMLFRLGLASTPSDRTIRINHGLGATGKS